MKVQCSGTCGRELTIRTHRIMDAGTGFEKEQAVYVISQPVVFCKRCHDKIIKNGMFGTFGKHIWSG